MLMKNLDFLVIIKFGLVMLASAILCHIELARRGLRMPELVLYGIRLLA